MGLLLRGRGRDETRREGGEGRKREEKGKGGEGRRRGERGQGQPPKLKIGPQNYFPGAVAAVIISHYYDVVNVSPREIFFITKISKS